MNSCNFFERKDIKSLEGLDIPEICKGDFEARKCPSLQSLKGGPKEVDGNYYVSGCNLRSLEGAPKKVRYTFGVDSNPHLQSLKGGPREVDENYYAHNCDLRSLEGAPKRVGESFRIYNNPKLTVDNVLKQKDFQNFFESLKNYREIKVDPEIQNFLKLLKRLSEKGETDISTERLEFLWKTSKSLK